MDETAAYGLTAEVADEFKRRLASDGIRAIVRFDGRYHTLVVSDGDLFEAESLIAEYCNENEWADDLTDTYRSSTMYA